MIVRGSGTIVNVQSPAGYTAWGGATGYIAGRYALRGLTTALQADTAGTGVTVQEAVVGETTSSYFSNNPGSKERIPQISAVLGTLTPHEAAEAVVGYGRVRGAASVPSVPARPVTLARSQA